MVEAVRSFVTQLMKKNVNSSGMLGRIQDVNMNLTQSNRLMVCAKDVLNIASHT